MKLAKALDCTYEEATKKLKALDIKVQAIQTASENEQFKQRLAQAENLLKENMGFCPVLQRNEIAEFLKS